MIATMILALALSADAGEPASTDAEAAREMARHIQLAHDADRRLRSFTCVFHRHEYKEGQLPAEQILLKHRTAPRSVYMKWTGEVQTGREVLWREGWNDGRLRAHKGSFPDLTVNLRPDSSLAMDGSRHPISMAGFAGTLEIFLRDFRLLRERPECLGRAVDLGIRTVRGARSRCFEAEMDKAVCKGLYSYKAQFCVHEELLLPTRIHVWDLEDGEVRLVEQYEYAEIRADAGLSDADFDPENEAYDF